MALFQIHSLWRELTKCILCCSRNLLLFRRRPRKRAVMNIGRRFMARVLSNCSTVQSVSGVYENVPALFIIMSMSPHVSAMCWRPASSACTSATSICKKRAPVSCAVRLPFLASISQKATWHPALQTAFTMALPIPEAPPLTNTRFGGYLMYKCPAFCPVGVSLGRYFFAEALRLCSSILFSK